MNAPNAAPHWTETADRISEPSPNPFWGHIAEDEYGTLLLPAWRNTHKDTCPGGWWDRRLNLRRPWHWLAYLRSRLTLRIGWVERP